MHAPTIPACKSAHSKIKNNKYKIKIKMERETENEKEKVEVKVCEGNRYSN